MPSIRIKNHPPILLTDPKVSLLHQMARKRLIIDEVSTKDLLSKFEVLVDTICQFDEDDQIPRLTKLISDMSAAEIIILMQHLLIESVNKQMSEHASVLDELLRRHNPPLMS